MVHRITTVLAGAQRSRRTLAACPRRDGSVDVERCERCPHARGFVGGDAEHARHVLCAVERTAAVRTEGGTVGSLMCRNVFCVRPDVDIEDIVLLFIERSIGGVPVVDGEQRPIGIISKSDLVPVFARRRGIVPLFDSFDADVAAEAVPVVARDLMAPVVFVLREGDSLAHAAELFAAKRVHRAPVVDGRGALVGVLTSFDLVRAIAGEGPQAT